jgi:hypothetical protein
MSLDFTGPMCGVTGVLLLAQALVTAKFSVAHTDDAMASEERRFIGDASI